MNARTSRSVFLSYASEDRAAARSLGEALARAGLDVWLDESELGGGDAWDQKIRRQIRDCDYFMPVISAQTEARHEGYFRREWRLAVERTLDMADDHLFLLPVVIDATDQATARVPERFLAVQWLRVPGGASNAALESLCGRLVAGETLEVATKRPPARSAGGAATHTAALAEFPVAAPGQRTRFLLQVSLWASRRGWLAFQRLPRWVRIVAYIWLGSVVIAHGCSSTHRHRTTELTPAAAAKLKAVAGQNQGNSNEADAVKLGLQIAREYAAGGTGVTPGSTAPSPAASPPTAPAISPAPSPIAPPSAAPAHQ